MASRTSSRFRAGCRGLGFVSIPCVRSRRTGRCVLLVILVVHLHIVATSNTRRDAGATLHSQVACGTVNTAPKNCPHQWGSQNCGRACVGSLDWTCTLRVLLDNLPLYSRNKPNIRHSRLPSMCFVSTSVLDSCGCSRCGTHPTVTCCGQHVIVFWLLGRQRPAPAAEALPAPLIAAPNAMVRGVTRVVGLCFCSSSRLPQSVQQ